MGTAHTINHYFRLLVVSSLSQKRAVKSDESLLCALIFNANPTSLVLYRRNCPKECQTLGIIDKSDLLIYLMLSQVLAFIEALCISTFFLNDILLVCQQGPT